MILTWFACRTANLTFNLLVFALRTRQIHLLQVIKIRVVLALRGKPVDKCQNDEKTTHQVLNTFHCFS